MRGLAALSLTLLLALGGVLASAEAQEGPYLVGPGDVLVITVLGAPPISAPVQVVVRPDGAISFPVAGEVSVQGKTVSAIAEALTKVLRERYRQIEVTINVTQFRERAVFVVGEVLKPGAVPLEGDSLNITQAILRAGGVDPQTKPTSARLFRPGQPPQPVDLTRAMGEGLPEVALELGEVLLVEPGKPKEVEVLGEVAKPGVYPLPEGARLSSALALAGSPTERGDARRAMVVRADGQTTVVDLEYLITHPESPVNVPLEGSTTLVVPPKNDLVVAGEVRKPASYVTRADTRVMDAIMAAGGLTETADPRGVLIVDRSNQTRLVDFDAVLAHPESEANVLLGDASVVFVGRDLRRYEVAVLGEIQQPQIIPAKDGLTLQAALAQTGGVTDEADPRGVQVIRADGAQETVDARAILGLQAPGTPAAPTFVAVELHPGDVVVVPRRYARALVLGAVRTQGEYQFDEGATAIDVIAKAGGFADKAVKIHTSLLRRQGGQVQVISLNLKAALRGSEALLAAPLVDGDIVYVPQGKPPPWDQISRAIYGFSNFVRIFTN